MHHLNNSLRFSASDLVGHLDCHHLTALDAAVASGSLTRPKIWDPVLQKFVERGLVCIPSGGLAEVSSLCDAETSEFMIARYTASRRCNYCMNLAPTVGRIEIVINREPSEL
jgi:hypothetical protein